MDLSEIRGESSMNTFDGALRENSMRGDCPDKAFVEQRIVNIFRKAAP